MEQDGWTCCMLHACSREVIPRNILEIDALL